VEQASTGEAIFSHGWGSRVWWDLNSQGGPRSQSGEISRGVFKYRENRGDITFLGARTGA
jgi:hypothetical protein